MATQLDTTTTPLQANQLALLASHEALRISDVVIDFMRDIASKMDEIVLSDKPIDIGHVVGWSKRIDFLCDGLERANEQAGHLLREAGLRAVSVGGAA